MFKVSYVLVKFIFRTKVSIGQHKKFLTLYNYDLLIFAVLKVMKATHISKRKEHIIVHLKIYMSDNDFYVSIDWNSFQ